MVEIRDKRVTASRLLREAHIKDYELWNWVRRGLLPRHCSLVIYGGQGSQSYYPAWAVERARKIKALRVLGMTMPEIRKRLKEAGELK